MSDGFSFGELKEKRTGTPKKRTSQRTTTVSKSTQGPAKPRTDYKKKFNDLEKDYKELGLQNLNLSKGLEIGKKAYDQLKEEFDELERWAEAVRKNETQMHELQDEIHRLTVQGNMDKKALDKTTMMLARLQFDPQKFSQLAQLLTYLRVHGNKQALIRVNEIVGTTELSAVRKWIFDLLEAPYK